MRANVGDCTSDYRGNASNLQLRGSNFRVHHIGSVNALCGSAMEVTGRDFDIYDNTIQYNGYAAHQASQPFPWADGITLLACNNGRVTNNTLTDNTDIDIVVGGGSGCTIENNTVYHTSTTYGFAGLHIGYFQESGGMHQNNNYRYNLVQTTSSDTLGFGLIAGFHPWNADTPVEHAGNLHSNEAYGAFTNLAVDGISNGSVQSNVWGGARGSKVMTYTCPNPQDYTAEHFGSASLQAGYTLRFYHGGCS